LNKEQFKLSR